MTGNIFHSNWAYLFGGAIANLGTIRLIEANTFVENWAMISGGAIFNSAGFDPLAIYNKATIEVIADCIFRGNQVGSVQPGGGGAITRRQSAALNHEATEPSLAMAGHSIAHGIAYVE